MGYAELDLSKLKLYKGEETLVSLRLQGNEEWKDITGSLDILICPENFGEEREEKATGKPFFELRYKIQLGPGMSSEKAKKLAESKLWQKAYEKYAKNPKKGKPVRVCGTDEEHIRYEESFNQVTAVARFQFGV